jgi:hypothetical protein
MIKSITAQGVYMQVKEGSTMTPYIPTNIGAQGVGNMRYNTQNQNLEVYDGATWQIFQTTYATVGLSYEAESLLNWAQEKRNEELKYKELIDQHPGIRDLKEKLDIMIALVTEQVKQGD